MKLSAVQSYKPVNFKALLEPYRVKYTDTQKEIRDDIKKVVFSDYKQSQKQISYVDFLKKKIGVDLYIAPEGDDTINLFTQSKGAGSSYDRAYLKSVRKDRPLKESFLDKYCKMATERNKEATQLTLIMIGALLGFMTLAGYTECSRCNSEYLQNDKNKKELIENRPKEKQSEVQNPFEKNIDIVEK